MNPRAAAVLVIVAAVVGRVGAAAALPALVANGPDDICSPTSDPCVIDRPTILTPPADFDFGLRSVRIVPGGSIEATEATLRCGEFVVVGAEATNAIRLRNTDLEAAYLSVTAQRGCSLDPALRCLDDSACATASAGTCTLGSGAITIGGQLMGRGAPAAYVVLRAAGDLRIDAPVIMHATSAAEDAGDLRLESLLGSIVVAAKLDLAGRKARGSYGETDGNPGLLSLKAGVDVTFTGPVDLSHGDYGGDLDVQAGRDIVVRADLALDSAPLSLEGNGGWLSLTAGRDIVIDVPEDGSDQTLVSSNGGHGLAMYRHWDAGGGGYSRIEALGDVRIAEGTAIEANSPFTYGGDGVPDGGYFKARIGGDFLLDGTIHLDGSGPSSGGGTAKIYTGGDIAIGANALLSARGDHSGEVRFDNSGGASRKRIAVRGGIDVRARRTRYDGETSYGYGGEIDIYSGDITLSGTLLAGDGGGGSEVRGNACSITLENSALIDQRSARGQYAGGTNDFSAEESFVAQAGSQILGLPSMTTTISYRRSSPPVLEGTIDPPPTLQPHDWTWASCPICGDGRRETGESCDDGNTSSGDGCTADCQDEGCLSQSPSYPAVPLCDDGDGCTLDTCNSTTHSCEHRSNCDDGVACSIDACVGGACTHTADDGACDDGNVCTSDLCNVTRDCVNALTHYVACEDGDLCTSTGRCNYYYYRSTCIASDVRAASAGRLRITPTGAAGGDAWMAIVKIPAAMATQPLTTTGLRVRLYRDSGSFVFDATIAAENFTGPHPGVYRFVDRDGKVPGARGIVDVLRRPGRDDTVVLRIKGRGADFARIYDAPLLGLSLLSGEDPTIDECTTARPLACKRTERRVLCGT